MADQVMMLESQATPSAPIEESTFHGRSEVNLIGSSYVDFLHTLIEKGENTHEVYSQFADKYDNALNEFQWSTSELFAKAFSTIIPDRGVNILDVACGSGRLGKELTTLGYECLDALDGCRPFFEKSIQRGVKYQNFIECYIRPDVKIPVENSSYDAILMSDAVYTDHLTPSHFKQLIPLLKPGGILGWSRLFCFTKPFDYVNLRPENYELVLAQLEREGQLSPVEGWLPKIVEELPGVMQQEVCFVRCNLTQQTL